MQLSDMKSHPVIKWMAYFGFGLIIISFVFFYGWDTSSTASFERANSYGRVESEDWLNFLPWRKWENVQADEVRNARLQVANRKLSTLDPTMQMILLQEGQRMGLRLEQLLSSDPEALQTAVDLRLLLREADRIGLKVSREEIARQIRNQPGMTAELWQRFLQSEGISESQYLDRMQRNQAGYLVQQLKADAVRVTLPELWRMYQSQNEKLRLEVVNFPAGKFADDVTVSEQEMQSYLDANAETFRVPARRKYAWVRVDRASIRSSIDPSAESLQTYYEENAEDFRRPEAAQVNDFFAPVADDQPTTAAQMLIAEARAAVEADPTADWEALRDTVRTNNPDYRFYFREVGDIEPGPESEEVHGRDYIEAAMALESGGLSDSVSSPLGLHLIKRTGTRESTIPSFEEIESRVRTAYIDVEAERLYKERVALMRGEMANFGSIKEFAEEHGFETGVTGMIDADESVLPGVADITRHRAYLGTLTSGVISETIPLGDRSLGLQILEEQESYVPALDEVREEIRATLEIDKALEKAETEARAALEKAAGASDLMAVANDLGTTRSLTPPLTRNGISRGAADSNLEGPLGQFADQSADAKPGSMGVSEYAPAPGADPDGYALWRVRDIESPVREEFLEARRRFAAGRQNELENIVIEEWLADERNKVEYEVFGVIAN